MLTKAEIKRLARWETQVTQIVENLREMIEAKTEAVEARREKYDTTHSDAWRESEAGQKVGAKLDADEAKVGELEQVADDLENAVQPLVDIETEAA